MLRKLLLTPSTALPASRPSRNFDGVIKEGSRVVEPLGNDVWRTACWCACRVMALSDRWLVTQVDTSLRWRRIPCQAGEVARASNNNDVAVLIIDDRISHPAVCLTTSPRLGPNGPQRLSAAVAVPFPDACTARGSNSGRWSGVVNLVQLRFASTISSRCDGGLMRHGTVGTLG